MRARTPPLKGEVDSPRAWLTVAATFVSSFVTLGVAYSFGAFFTSMAEEFDSTRGETAVIFGITTFSFFWLSLATGRAADYWGPRPVLLTGSLSLLVSLLATSRVESLALGYLTIGAGVGLAAACGYIPMVATVGGWFEQHRATAMGLAVAGIGAGTLVMSPLSARLIEQYGWRQTYVIFGVGGSALLLLAVAFIDRPPGQLRAQPGRFAEAARSSVFRRLWISGLFSGLALFVPFVFVGQYAKDQGVDSVAAASLIGFMGGASVLARIGFGSLVKRFGSFVLYRLCFALTSLSFLIWLFAADSYPALVAFVVVLGVGYGGFVALSSIVMAGRMGVAGLGSVLGMFYTSQGLGGLIGPPTAGWLIDRLGTYRPIIVGCCALAALAGLALTGLPTANGSLLPEPAN